MYKRVAHFTPLTASCTQFVFSIIRVATYVYTCIHVHATECCKWGGDNLNSMIVSQTWARGKVVSCVCHCLSSAPN